MRKLKFALAGVAAIAASATAVALVATSDHEHDNPWLIGLFAVTAGVSFIQAAWRTFSTPSVTVATSDNFTGASLRYAMIRLR